MVLKQEVCEITFYLSYSRLNARTLAKILLCFDSLYEISKKIVRGRRSINTSRLEIKSIRSGSVFFDFVTTDPIASAIFVSLVSEGVKGASIPIIKATINHYKGKIKQNRRDPNSISRGQRATTSEVKAVKECLDVMTQTMSSKNIGYASMKFKNGDQEIEIVLKSPDSD